MAHDTGGVAVNSHLLFKAVAIDAVPLARLAVGVGQELRDDEQGNTANPLRRALDAGQDQVDNVLGEVVLAAGNPDLRA